MASTCYKIALRVFQSLPMTRKSETHQACNDRARMSLQKGLRKISEWSEKWEKPFNVNKCHILQIVRETKNLS